MNYHTAGNFLLTLLHKTSTYRPFASDSRQSRRVEASRQLGFQTSLYHYPPPRTILAYVVTGTAAALSTAAARPSPVFFVPRITLLTTDKMKLVKIVIVFGALLALLAPATVGASREKESSRDQNGNFLLYGAAAVAGGAAAVFAAPLILPVIGFTSAGISAGSLGASLMSASAVANGGGIASGGLVATLQAVGAGGLGSAGTALLGTLGAGVGYKGAQLLEEKDKK